MNDREDLYLAAFCVAFPALLIGVIYWATL